MKKRFTDEQVVRILREAESKQESIRDVCKRHNISEQTFFRWRNKFGGMDVAEARRLTQSGVLTSRRFPRIPGLNSSVSLG